MRATPHVLGAGTVVELIAPHCLEILSASARDLAPTAVRALPRWVREYGLVACGTAHWMWIDGEWPAEAADAEHPERDVMGQIVLDLPPGRYTVDILNTASGSWISRESAVAAPLVAGVPFAQAPLVVRFRPVWSASPPSTGRVGRQQGGAGHEL
jgi:hypothetical protein